MMRLVGQLLLALLLTAACMSSLNTVLAVTFSRDSYKHSLISIIFFLKKYYLESRVMECVA